MTQQYKYKVMLADKGGMTISDAGKDVYVSDDNLALTMDKWILETIEQSGCGDATVEVSITTETE